MIVNDNNITFTTILYEGAQYKFKKSETHFGKALMTTKFNENLVENLVDLC